MITQNSQDKSRRMDVRPVGWGKEGEKRGKEGQPDPRHFYSAVDSSIRSLPTRNSAVQAVPFLYSYRNPRKSPRVKVTPPVLDDLWTFQKGEAFKGCSREPIARTDLSGRRWCNRFLHWYSSSAIR